MSYKYRTHVHTWRIDVTLIWTHEQAKVLSNCLFQYTDMNTYEPMNMYEHMNTSEHMNNSISIWRCEFVMAHILIMGWLRLIGSLKLQFSFSKYSLFYRALLQKRHMILRSLSCVAAPYLYINTWIFAGPFEWSFEFPYDNMNKSLL